MSDPLLPCLREQGGGPILQVLVRPRSSRNRIEGLQGDALKLSLAAAPVGNKANQDCLELLAHHLGLSPSQLWIKAGSKSHRKLIALEGCSLPHLQQRLRAILGEREQEIKGGSRPRRERRSQAGRGSG